MDVWSRLLLHAETQLAHGLHEAVKGDMQLSCMQARALLELLCCLVLCFG